MITSTLGRKVFDQVELRPTIENAWWVERRLQKMQINGLVKMIRSSKELRTDYIDGYISQYKWSFRNDSINIDNCEELFYILQLLSVDFSWGMWKDILMIDDVGLLHQCIQTAVMNNKGNLSYSLAIYRSRKQELQNKMDEISRYQIPSTQIIGTIHNVSIDLKDKWKEIKTKI